MEGVEEGGENSNRNLGISTKNGEIFVNFVFSNFGAKWRDFAGNIGGNVVSIW